MSWAQRSLKPAITPIAAKRAPPVRLCGERVQRRRATERALSGATRRGQLSRRILYPASTPWCILERTIVARRERTTGNLCFNATAPVHEGCSPIEGSTTSLPPVRSDGTRGIVFGGGRYVGQGIIQRIANQNLAVYRVATSRLQEHVRSRSLVRASVRGESQAGVSSRLCASR